MNISSIMIASASIGGMGLIFGSALAFASQKFAVETDPRTLDILDVLPGANCGGCGFPGCGGLAAAIVAGDAPVNACPVGGPDCAAKVAAIMGIEADTSAKKVARVLCKGDCDTALERFKYEGITDCKAAAMLLGGSKACQNGCMGLGTCERACPFGAIHINNKGIAVVDPEKCVACGLCIKVCPKNVIAYVPYGQEVVVDCKNAEKGGHVKKNCGVACIACGICEKNCPFDAIHVVDNVARIDYEKCTSCMVCVEKCPTKAIAGDLSSRKKAFIDEAACIGCTICKKACPVEAIEGELKEKHHILQEKCIGCGACTSKCPKKAISMK